MCPLHLPLGLPLTPHRTSSPSLNSGSCTDTAGLELRFSVPIAPPEEGSATLKGLLPEGRSSDGGNFFQVPEETLKISSHMFFFLKYALFSESTENHSAVLILGIGDGVVTDGYKVDGT